jgi:hypothetical protein
MQWAVIYKTHDTKYGRNSINTNYLCPGIFFLHVFCTIAVNGLGLLDVAHRRQVLTQHRVTETVPISSRWKYREEKRSIRITRVSWAHATNRRALSLLQWFWIHIKTADGFSYFTTAVPRLCNHLFKILWFQHWQTTHTNHGNPA